MHMQSARTGGELGGLGELTVRVGSVSLCRKQRRSTEPLRRFLLCRRLVVKGIRVFRPKQSLPGLAGPSEITMRTILVAAAAFVALSAHAQPRSSDVIREAEAFMEAYAGDLSRGDRSAVAARYDRGGAYFLIAGGREFASHDAITRNYASSWQPPTRFEWRDLKFDAVGTDAVVVNGWFTWGGTDGAKTFTYTGFLRRQDGKLRIRLEDETLAMPQTGRP